MNQIQKMLSLFTVTLLLAACGGSGSTTDLGSLDAQKPVTITGQVQQGNIKGAQVFLDLNGNGVKEAGEPASLNPTGADGKFALSLTAGQVTALKAASATAKIVSVGGTDTTTTLEVGLLASDLPAITGDTATKNITAMTTLTAMTPDAKKGELKAVLGTLGLRDDSGSANDDKLIENATPAVIALCKSVESALLNVKKATTIEAAQAVAAEMGKALLGKTKADLTDTQKLADTLATAAGTALSAKKTELGLTDAQVAAMVTAIGKGCKGVADAVMSKCGGTLSTETHNATETESEIMHAAETEIHGIVETANAEVETGSHSGVTIPPVIIPPVVTADTTAPAVTAFTMPATAASLIVSVSTFTATDNAAVTGYMVTQSATPPAATAAGWTATATATVIAAAAGSQNFFPWAKDATGNVSAIFGTPATVTITLPPASVAVLASGTDTTSAVGVDATFTFAAVANTPIVFNISGFGAGDKLVFPVFGGAPNLISIVNPNITDGSVTFHLIRKVGGDAFEITVVLNGLTALQDGQIVDGERDPFTSFKAVFGANSIQQL